MKQDDLSFFTDTHLTVIGLVIFVLFFVGVVFWVNRKGGKQFYSSMEQMPLKEGELTYERL
ncbi:MAG TPA: hypothetical protein VN132_16625 [Bdellovibrio sp.]|nr:hypothetical protein [Bdellovibrio sp.]